MRDLRRRYAGQILLQKNSVAWAAEREDPCHINGSQINSNGLAAEFRQCLIQRFSSYQAAIQVKCDRVYPSDDHTFVAQLAQSLPASYPGSLCDLTCIVAPRPRESRNRTVSSNPRWYACPYPSLVMSDRTLRLKNGAASTLHFRDQSHVAVWVPRVR